MFKETAFLIRLIRIQYDEYHTKPRKLQQSIRRKKIYQGANQSAKRKYKQVKLLEARENANNLVAIGVTFEFDWL